MPRNVPPNRPRLTSGDCLSLLATRLGAQPTVALLGVRGYFLDTMGTPGANDRGIYDDCIALWSPTAFAAFNANCDPSAFRPGIAVLQPGVWHYRKGKHKITSPTGYAALVQAAQVTVMRDGTGADTGWFGINIHKGSLTSTSSLGCQTIYPPQWDAFRALVYAELDRHQQAVLPYVLLNEQDRH